MNIDLSTYFLKRAFFLHYYADLFELWELLILSFYRRVESKFDINENLFNVTGHITCPALLQF